MGLTLIACIDMDNGIGDSNGNLLFNIPKDLQHFKETTLHKYVVMGRKTWDSLPKKPLPKRKNYVLTRDENFVAEGAKVIHSIDEALELSKNREVFIIGGGEIYEQFMPHADKLILTQVHHMNPFATTYFPDFTMDDWKWMSSVKHEVDDENPHSFAITEYKRINKN